MGMRLIAKTTVFIAIFVAAATAPAMANYQLRSLTNHTNQIVGISFPVGPGGRGSSTFISGDMVVAIPGNGIVSFTAKGHDGPCEHPYWHIALTYKDQQWGFFYDGEGYVDMTINADGSLAFGAANGVIVNGSGPPACQ